MQPQKNNWYRLISGSYNSIVYCAELPSGELALFEGHKPALAVSDLTPAEQLIPVTAVDTDKYLADRTDFAQLVEFARSMLNNGKLAELPFEASMVQNILNKRASAYSDTHQSIA